MHSYSSAGIALLLTCFILIIGIGWGAEEEVKDEELRVAFKKAEEDFNNGLSVGDCNAKLTRDTLKFLSIDSTNLTSNLKNLDGLDLDCSDRKTDFNKLRVFMLNSGYFQNQGSLHFINDQDTNLKLKCGKEGRWRVVDLNTKEEDDKFNKEGNFAKDLNTVAPVGYRYFRKFSCFSLKEQCDHTFYVITRPHPKMDFPLQAMENQPEFKFSCKISVCTHGGTDDDNKEGCRFGGKNVKPNHQKPYTIFMRAPGKIFESDNSSYLSCKGNNADDDEKPKYFPVIEDGKKVNDSNSTLKLKKGFKVSAAGNGLGFTVEITTVSRNGHAGNYECVVIDNNGVPSIPNHGKFSSHKRFSGKAKLHVRPFIMMIVPAAIIGGTIVLMLIIWIVFRKNDHMENDEGLRYKKEEMVTPAEEPQPSTEKIEENTPKSKAENEPAPKQEKQE